MYVEIFHNLAQAQNRLNEYLSDKSGSAHLLGGGFAKIVDNIPNGAVNQLCFYNAPVFLVVSGFSQAAITEE